MVIIYAFAKSSYFFCQDDGKPEGLLQRRMCWHFFYSFQTLTGSLSICVHQGEEVSTDLIAPRDSSQAGGLSRLATLLPLNARFVHEKGISETRPGNSWRPVLSPRTQPALKIVHRPHSFIHPCFFSRGIKKVLKPKET